VGYLPRNHYSTFAKFAAPHRHKLLNMTLILSNDPGSWPTIIAIRTSSYAAGSSWWRISVLTQSWWWFCSCMLHHSGVRLGWIVTLIGRIIDISLSCSPALTFGQEVSQCDSRSNHLTANGSIGRTGLGEYDSEYQKDCWLIYLIGGRGNAGLS
jgi:hypothetical protein